MVSRCMMHVRFTYCDFCGRKFEELLPILQCWGVASLSAFGYICSCCIEKLKRIKDDKVWQS
jgi:hypothetical protein